MIMMRLCLLAFLTLAGCSHTATTTGPNGERCVSTGSSFLFSMTVTSECRDSNGNVISHSEMH
jgi:hypothetical protein